MKNFLKTCTDRSRHMRRTAKRIVSLFTALALAASCGAFWQLRSAGVAFADEVYSAAKDNLLIEENGSFEQCGPEGGSSVSDGDEVHVRDESCYESLPACELPGQIEESESEGSELNSGGKPLLTWQTLQAGVYTDTSLMNTLSVSESITLCGMMPENAVATAYPVDAEIEGVRILAAYDITIRNGNGAEFEPEDERIHVTISNASVREALADDAELLVFHINDETSAPEEIEVTGTEDGSVEFDASGFSIYIVGEDEGYYDIQTGETVTVYTIEFYQYEFDATDETARGPVLTSTQYAAANDTLNEPSVPEYAHHVFDGWFTQMQISSDNEPGGRFDFDETVGENLESWGGDYEPGDSHAICLYTDYDPVYYVSFMTEEEPVLNPGDVSYEPYVFHTNVYHENSSALDTADAGILYWQQYLQVEQDEGDLTTYAVVDWYYYDETDRDADADGKVLISKKSGADGYFHITDDLILYPVVEGAVWIYFDMCIDDLSEVYIEPSPVYVMAYAEKVGGVLPNANRPGYTFDGWWTEETGGIHITDNTSFDDLKSHMQNGAVTLYAHWTPAKVGYTVNIWRQKATDGQPGLNQKVVRSGETYEEYIRYYDYAESYTVSASDGLICGTQPQTSVLSRYTGLGSVVYNGTGAYNGFEYNRTRTENDLAAKTMAPDGSTIINVFYDRVTVTWNFYRSNSSTTSSSLFWGSLIGLYGTNIDPGDDSIEVGGTKRAWGNYTNGNNSYPWCYTKSNGSTMTIIFETEYVLRDTRNPATVNYYYNSSTSSGGYIYYYLEVTNEETQVDLNGPAASEAASNNVDYLHTVTLDGEERLYVYDRMIRLSSNNVSYKVNDKFIGYDVAGICTVSIRTSGSGAGQTTTTSYGNVSSIKAGYSIDSIGSSDRYCIFNNAEVYTIDFYSNHDGEQLVESAEFKYGADLSGFEFPYELDAEKYGPAYYYQFTGTWYEDPTFTAQFIKPDTMPANNLVAYADWELKDITVTFHSAVESDLYDLLKEAYGEFEEDTNPAGVVCNDDGSYSVTVSAGDVISPTLAELTASDEEDEDRFTFVSWMKGTGIFNVTSHLYDDTTLTASWNDAQKEHHKLYYVVNLDSDSYTGTSYWTDGREHSVDEGAGEELKTVEDVFNAKNTGADLDEDQTAKFICWNTQPDGSGTDYYPDELYSFENDYADVILFAKWATELKSVLHVHYNYPGDYDPGVDTEYTDVDITVENLGTVDLSDETLIDLHKGDEITIDGVTYRFAGWSTYEDAHTEGDVEIPIDATIAVDGTDTDEERINDIYAVWLAELTFSIRKTDMAGEQIEGAVFTLSYTVSVQSDGQVTFTSCYYTPVTDNEGNVTYSWEKPTPGQDLPTITLGEISFTDHDGIFDGSETFTLIEVTAPDGYLGLANEIVFTLDAADSSVVISQNVPGHNNDAMYLAEADGTVLTVRNESGTRLPDTGGIGTGVYYVLGLVMMGAAVYLFCLKKSKKTI